MVQFAQIEYLLIILLIPLVFIAHALMRLMWKRRLSKFGESQIIAPLMPDSSKAKGWFKLAILSIAIFFFAIGLSRPQLGARIKEMENRGIEIMIALDVSNSMLAEDYSPNRLERAKLAVSRLVDKLREDRIGLIVFAGQAFVQLPVTTDYVSAKIFLNTIGTSSVPIQGTALGDAISLGIRSFSVESTNNSRAIILITDGENHEDDPVAIAKVAKEAGVQVHTIGIGSETGMPIPMGGGELLRDRDGNIVVTKLDEATLVEVAKAGGGVYVRAGNSDFGLDAIVEKIKELDRQSFRSIVFEDFDEQYMYFLGIALFFLILEFLMGERRMRRFFK